MIAQEPSYQHLISAIEKGNERAFGMLYDLFSGDLSRYILSKVVSTEVAQDILHDLFLSLWKNRERIQKIHSLPSYLYSSCRYLIIAHFRNHMREVSKDYNLEELDVLDNSVPLEDRLHFRYIIDMVENEIENLPEKCRLIFKLSRHDFLSNKEIAERLQISESTVEKHINKALKRLREISKGYTWVL